MATEAHLGPLMAALLAIVDDRIARALDRRDVKPDVYSTAPGGTHPGSRRAFLERVRKHPKARRIGGKRGRGVCWEIDRADFETEKTKTPTGNLKAPVVSIDSWIAEAGYRRTRAS
jgi:hypothetical protein